MKRTKPIAISLILLILLRNPLMRLIHLDFATIEVGVTVRLLTTLIFLVSVGLLVTEKWKEDFSKWKKTWTMSLTIVVAWIFISFFNVYMQNFEPITTVPVFVHKTNGNQIRYYSLPFNQKSKIISLEMLMAKPIGTHFIFYKKINFMEDDISQYEPIQVNKN